MRPRVLLLLVLVVATAAPLVAQTYVLRDGRTLAAGDVVVRDGHLMQTLRVDGGVAEIGTPFSAIARLDWPEPAALRQARADFAVGRFAEAAEAVAPVVRQFADFPRTPGSWWREAALLRARALLAAGAGDDAARAAQAIIDGGADDEAVALAGFVLAELDFRAGRAEAAASRLDALAAAATPELEPRVWLLRGDLALAREDWVGALDAYLRLPAFFGTRDDLLPRALLGSARAYRGRGDASRAERAWLEVIDTWPDSAEAAAARTEAGLSQNQTDSPP